MAFNDTPPVFSVPRHELHILRYLYLQPQMAQMIIQLNPQADGNAVTFTINGKSATFEFDNNSSVTAGRVPVTIGGTGPATGASFAAALTSVYGDVIRLANDGAWEYILANTPDCDMSASIVTGSYGLDKLQPARPQQPMAVAFINRTVTASEQTKATINVYTGIDTIYFVNTIFRTSNSNFTIVPYNGNISVSGEIVQMAQGTTTGVFTTGMILQVIVMGDKVE